MPQSLYKEAKFPAVLDSTIMKAWKACPQKCFLEFFCGLRENADMLSVDLVAGKAMASGLEIARKAFYFGDLPAREAIEEGQIALGAEYGQDRPEEKKNLSRVREALEKYFTVWPLDRTVGIIPRTKKDIEHSFSIPLGVQNPSTGKELVYSGRLDLVGTLAVEESIFGFEESVPALWGEDDKTTGSINSTFFYKYDLDWQMLGYTWAMRETGENIEGLRVRGIGLTNKKVFDVTTDFKETTVVPSGDILANWHTELMQTVAEMLHIWGEYQKAGDTGLFSHNYANSCFVYNRLCAYHPVCTHSPQLPEYVIHHWNPLDHGKKEA